VEAPDQWISWLFRIGGPVASVLLTWHLVRAPRQTSLRQAMLTVVPANDAVCPFCQTPLLAGPNWYCPACGVVRY
jgi:hypothetical protein